MRSYRFYRIDSAWPDSEQALSEQLAARAFEPCGSFSERSLGFEAPLAELQDVLCRRVMGADLLSLRIQSRVLPGAAIREALVERVTEFKQRTQREPGRNEKRDLREEVYGDLLPKALLKSDHVHATYLHAESVLAVGTASLKAAEQFLDALRDALGSLKAAPLTFKEPADQFLGRVFLGNKTGPFHVGRECRMSDPSESGSSITWLAVDLTDTSIRQLLKNGFRIDRLGLTVERLLTCTLDKDLVVRKLKLIEDVEDLFPDEDPSARFDADFAIASGALKALLKEFEHQLK